ncbi:MAG TPA: TonB-dependent receptor [Bryobacterales bacterium]|nr:TonB-dependent receptor [Bryobacterales bacterium]
MRKSLRILCVFLGAAALLDAQTATGRLSGSVIDPEGLPVPGARITVTGESTGVTLAGVSNPLGAFSFADVPPGEYSIEVNAASFRRQVARHFKVDVAKDNVLWPVRLELGPVTQTVEITAGASQVQTTTAENSATVTMQQIQHLPLVDRNPLSLIGLQAGVAFNGASAANGTVINGQRTSYSNVTLDGINIQDNFIRENALDFVPNQLLVDQVREFTITTQNGNAALGQGASQVNFVTPSGTNELHGGGYWFNRNNKFAANQWFSNKSGTPKPFLNLNQAGGTLGGPIKKDKLFFYTNYEAYRQRQQDIENSVILTANARQGIFTYRDSHNRVERVNVLRAAAVRPDPKVATLLDSVPPPSAINNFDVGDSDPTLLRNTAGYQFNVRDRITRDNLTTRIDYNRSEHHIITGTYLFNRDNDDRPDQGDGFHTVPVVQSLVHAHFLSVGWRWTPGPAFTNEVRGGMNLAPGNFAASENLGSQLFDGFIFTNPVVNFEPNGRTTNTFSYMDNANWQRGNHSLRFGAQFQRIYASPFDKSGLRPDYSIGLSAVNPLTLDPAQFPGGISTIDLAAAQDLLASLGGIIGGVSQSFNVASRTSGFVPGQQFQRHYSLNNYSFYGQDSWKVSRRLTLNLGLRWEYAGRFDERDGLMLSPIFSSIGVVNTLLSNATLDFAGHVVNRPLYNKDLNNFAPNIGIAFDPFGDGKTAIRAGYSINYVNDEAIRSNDNATLANDGLIGIITQTDLVTTMSGTLPTFKAPPFQVPRTASQNFDLNPGAAIFAIDPNLRTPYVQQWTFGIQRQVARDTVIDVRYAGNHGTKLLRGFDYNQVIVKQNGFLDDFVRARNNAFLAQKASGAFDPNYNPGIAGSQRLTVFPQLAFGGLLDNATIQSLIRTGEVGQLAAIYYVNGLQGSVPFTPNPNTFVADLLTNYSNSSYNALQAEVRRRLTGGIEFQANYTFSKVLTDSSGGSQVRFDPFLDFGNGKIERARADFDLTHIFNANFVVPLPMGGAHRLRYKPLDRVLSNWTLGSILGWQSGAPLSIVSGRATLNRSSRSGENTAITALTKSQLDQIVQFRMTGNGPFLIAQSAISPQDNSGVAGDGQPAFQGQVFFHPGPGQLGTLQRRMFSGPSAFALDMKLDKEIPITERQRLRLETTFTNLLNHPSFFGGGQALDSTQFGRITSVLVGARVIQFGLRYSF